ncbi:hypothetical protein MXMO3_00907 [Maritalea myrionectae]|uniref:Uncharacterized protein n=1 Tax=Maritalea myrionectae TaxID=454601 RepID=A0A2R4MC43_9HYPH|nr:hypothetical protein [Maritalea myrionectae]AVX03439.1 hypothetical protein MXMO3_00907 [Maritalea myrionectae]
MNRYGIVMLVTSASLLIIAVVIRLSYLNTSVLFGLVALAFAPLAMHRFSQNATISALVGLSLFAAYPLYKLVGQGNIFTLLGFQVGYLALFWVIGAGWKRDWKSGRSS